MMVRRSMRRHVLIGSAASLIANPFLRVARGQTDQVQRGSFFVVFYYPQNVRRSYFPRGTENQFTLSPQMPLEDVRQHVTFFGNNVVAKSSWRGWENHLGVNHILTANGTRNDAMGPSLDQVLADRWMATKPTALRSLHVWSSPPKANTSTPSWRGYKQPVRPEGNPQEAFKQVFANAASGIAPAELTRIEKRRQSLLDSVKGELSELSRALGTEEARMLSGHLESVREVERNLFAKTGAEVQLPACSSARTAVNAPTSDPVNASSTSYPVVLKAQMDVAVAAIACGITRVAVVQGGDNHNNYLTFPWLGISSTHHLGIQHGDGPGYEEVTAWFIRQYAYLLLNLKKIPTSRGTLLDEGLVMHATPFGYGHSQYGLPYLLGGHAGGRIKGGQFMQTGDSASKLDAGMDVGDLLLTVAHALDMTHLEFFGDKTHSKGLIPGLLQPSVRL